MVGIIPARYASQRFPGKPLAQLGSRSMIQCVYEASCESSELEQVIVATDDRRIYDHVGDFGGEAVMTPPEVATGTDRCFLAAEGLGATIVVNIQGDEPLLRPDVIDETVRALRDNQQAVCATPICPCDDQGEISSPHVVKVAAGCDGTALYFSRSVIPYERNRVSQAYYKHIGLYAYRFSFLQKYSTLKQTPLELAESLEQLRILEHGYKIQCAVVKYDAIGVDTPEDLDRVRAILTERNEL